MGNHVKEGIPWSTMLGLVAVDLAQDGFTGPLDILDHPDYFNPDLIKDMPISARAIENTYFKPYSSCRWSHAAIDALVSILTENRLPYESINQVTVETFERALRLNNYPDPSCLEAAQYSIPFCLGVVAVKGPAALLPLMDASLKEADIVNFARRITLTRDTYLNDLFPRQTPARVRVETSAGSFEKTVMDPRGDPANPMEQTELEAKFCLPDPEVSDYRISSSRSFMRSCRGSFSRRIFFRAIAGIRGNITMKHWLMKSEPTTFSIDDLVACPDQTDHWDGVRNYQARNFLRDEIRKGDASSFTTAAK